MRLRATGCGSTFKVDSGTSTLGPDSSAAAKVLALVGTEYLEITPAGRGRLRLGRSRPAGPPCRSPSSTRCRPLSAQEQEYDLPTLVKSLQAGTRGAVRHHGRRHDGRARRARGPAPRSSPSARHDLVDGRHRGRGPGQDAVGPPRPAASTSSARATSSCRCCSSAATALQQLFTGTTSLSQELIPRARAQPHRAPGAAQQPRDRLPAAGARHRQHRRGAAGAVGLQHLRRQRHRFRARSSTPGSRRCCCPTTCWRSASGRPSAYRAATRSWGAGREPPAGARCAAGSRCPGRPGARRPPRRTCCATTRPDAVDHGALRQRARPVRRQPGRRCSACRSAASPRSTPEPGRASTSRFEVPGTSTCPTRCKALILAPDLISDRIARADPAYTAARAGRPAPPSRSSAQRRRCPPTRSSRASTSSRVALGPDGANTDGDLNEAAGAAWRRPSARTASRCTTRSPTSARPSARWRAGPDLTVLLNSLGHLTTDCAQNLDSYGRSPRTWPRSAPRSPPRRATSPPRCRRCPQALGELSTFVTDNAATLGSSVASLNTFAAALTRQQAAARRDLRTCRWRWRTCTRPSTPTRPGGAALKVRFDPSAGSAALGARGLRQLGAAAADHRPHGPRRRHLRRQGRRGLLVRPQRRGLPAPGAAGRAEVDTSLTALMGGGP